MKKLLIEPKCQKPNDITLLSKKISDILNGVLKTSKCLLTRSAIQKMVTANCEKAKKQFYISTTYFNQL